ncbi:MULTISPECIES: hypothetical protein [unclassified Caballeronia]|uniref:hypothetical protein n=1 Tax=unclassified Caballeronia TaxID=2646786 RepID=UPI0028663D3D|nr:MULTISPECIES: hypothetical protein [unclassified Caballeronia]MDR5777595.1 hypothetical protein [Caballeronia sp. LZ002]MDR5802351.1 hypothetical protein [Caballeronia sp. LZ001]MDR5853031.1 hypothetical protein [Caballeronia sp. LZ003]
MHIEKHKQMLKQATSETLNEVVTQIKEERPNAFHVEAGANETVSQRRFAYEPATPLPMAGFNVPRSEAAAAIQTAMRKSSDQGAKR